MMLCIDGVDIETLTLALVERNGEAFALRAQETLARRLGDELGVIEDFLARNRVALGDVSAFGVVRGPGSAGALRSVLSLVNAWAIASSQEVFSVLREGELWHAEGHPLPYVLPVYDRPVHTTSSSKDALRRKI